MTQLSITTVVVVLALTWVATTTVSNATAIDAALALVALTVVAALRVRVGVGLTLTALTAKPIGALTIIATTLAFTAAFLTLTTPTDLPDLTISRLTTPPWRRHRNAPVVTALQPITAISVVATPLTNVLGKTSTVTTDLIFLTVAVVLTPAGQSATTTFDAAPALAHLPVLAVTRRPAALGLLRDTPQLLLAHQPLRTALPVGA